MRLRKKNSNCIFAADAHADNFIWLVFEDMFKADLGLSHVAPAVSHCFKFYCLQ